MLEWDEVEVARARRVLLARVTLRAEPGELLALIGPNGAGKSTLLRVASGSWRPEAGRVRFAQRELGAWPRAELARRLAVLPQTSTLGFDFTVDEVVALGRLPHAAHAPQARQRRVVADAVRAFDLEGLVARPYLSLSAGEQQRVQAARAFAQLWEPATDGVSALLLDEPTSSLDLAHQQLVLENALRLRDRGVAVVVVLHDLNLAAAFADRVALLSEGRLAACGPPGDVLRPELLDPVYGVTTAVLRDPASGRPSVFVRRRSSIHCASPDSGIGRANR